MESDGRVTAAELASWVRESLSGVERCVRKGLFEPGDDALFDLMGAVQNYVAYWQQLSVRVESRKENIVSTDQLCEFLPLDRAEIDAFVLAGVLEPEAPDRFALLRSTKAFATAGCEALGRGLVPVWSRALMGER